MLNETGSLVGSDLFIRGSLRSISTRGIIESWYWTLPTAFLLYCVLDVLHIRISVKRQGHTPQGAIPVSNSLFAAPRFILNLIWAFRSFDHLQEAYRKYGKSSFQVVRNNGSFVVLPQHLVEELASLPTRVSDPSASLEAEFLGHLGGFDFIKETNLQRITAQRRLTSRIPLITPSLEKTLSEECRKLLPDSEEWTEFQPHSVLEQFSARITSEAIVGPKFRTNPTWIDIAIHYTEGVFITSVILRFFPEWMQWTLSNFMPVCWQGKKYLRKAKELLGPRIRERVAASDSGAWEPSDDNPEDADLLSWLCHTVKGPERNVDTISHCIVILAFASVHTTGQRMNSILLDLAADTSLRDVLIEEITSVASKGWSAASYDELKKMDSTLRESQRTSPPLLTGMRRYFNESYTFKDGTFIPAGTNVCMAVYSIENDEANTPRPEVFDGLRAYRLREERERSGADLDSTAAKEHLFTTPTPTALAWGYGKMACPGRFFAGAVIKIFLVKLLTEYEFKFMPGAGKPALQNLHEHYFAPPSLKMLIRRRKGSSAPF
ncbi:Ent-kaurene oxidase [Escovopsis weberi]|uniref:Ent-kaurene oxidase n=1 Tax=Escovopsis weberi TaxID=150374 RepID=A0A0M8N4J8_ESCWE|nr:Ent-kaurene oxidase [Escovopsis weberi]